MSSSARIPSESTPETVDSEGAHAHPLPADGISVREFLASGALDGRTLEQMFPD